MLTTLFTSIIAALSAALAFYIRKAYRNEAKAKDAEKIIKTIDGMDKATIAPDTNSAREWLRKHGRS